MKRQSSQGRAFKVEAELHPLIISACGAPSPPEGLTAGYQGCAVLLGHRQHCPKKHASTLQGPKSEVVEGEARPEAGVSGGLCQHGSGCGLHPFLGPADRSFHINQNSRPGCVSVTLEMQSTEPSGGSRAQASDQSGPG